MSLAQRVNQAVDRAFIALDDLKGSMTLTSLSNDPNYSAATGSVTKSEQTYTVEAIFDLYETDRVDGTIIQREDRRILVKPQIGMTPKVGDTITDGDGVTYNVMDVESVRAYDEVFLWELQARK